VRLARRLVLGSTLCACAPVDSAGTAGAEDFCATLDDSDQYRVDAGSTSTSGGDLVLRLLSVQTEDPADPQWISFVDYTLEPTSTTGAQTPGRTSGDGLVERPLGQGAWLFKASKPRGSSACVARIEFPIDSGQTTRACAVMRCPS
jgi:hypothetical protein